MSVLQKGSLFLKRQGIEDYRIEASYLLRFSLGISEAAKLYAEPERRLTDEQEGRYFLLLKERACGEPLAYITGEKEFYGLTFRVNESVMIPRPVTEHLVDAVLDWLDEQRQECIELLEIGTGSGCISVALALSDGRVKVVATDISYDALSVAKDNIRRHKVDARIRVVLTNIAGGILTRRSFDCVVSNPPYLTDAEYESASVEVHREPQVALRGGEDGLSLYRPIIEEASHLLREGGLLALELNPYRVEEVRELVLQSGLSDIRVLPDYYGNARVLLAHLKTA